MSERHIGLAAVILVAATSAGCSTSTSDSTSPTRAAGSDRTNEAKSPPNEGSSSEPEDSQRPDRALNCLFDVPQVSEVLGGAWERHPKTGEPCTYTSDRGAVFVTTRVEDDIAGGLQDARDACVPGIKPIEVSDHAFVCVEDRQPSDLVVGNTVSQGAVWVAVIVPPDANVPEAQVTAMTALMSAVPR